MNEERLNLLENYIKAGISPILVSDVPSDIFHNSVIIKASINKGELNGHYEDIEYCTPEWYKETIEKSKVGYVGLIIENINEIEKEEQAKFIEILKYKKVSTFDLPRNCFIIVTCTNLKNKKINEEVYSLLVHI